MDGLELPLNLQGVSPGNLFQIFPIVVETIFNAFEGLDHFLWVHEGVMWVTNVGGCLMISFGDAVFEAFVDTFFADVIFFLHKAVIAIGLGFLFTNGRTVEEALVIETVIEITVQH